MNEEEARSGCNGIVPRRFHVSAGDGEEEKKTSWPPRPQLVRTIFAWQRDPGV